MLLPQYIDPFIYKKEIPQLISQMHRQKMQISRYTAKALYVAELHAAPTAGTSWSVIPQCKTALMWQVQTGIKFHVEMDNLRR